MREKSSSHHNRMPGDEREKTSADKKMRYVGGRR